MTPIPTDRPTAAADAEADLRQGVAPADLDEVRRDDPDDQGRLEALAEHDQEGRDHAQTPGSG